MTSYVALLRAVNVGGTGKLPMTELRAMCEGCGFKDVRTYIASGNVVFRADPDEAAVQAKLEAALQAHAGKPVGVAVRTGDWEGGTAQMAKGLLARLFWRVLDAVDYRVTQARLWLAEAVYDPEP